MRPYWQSSDGAITVYHARFEDVLAAGVVPVREVALVHDDSHAPLVQYRRRHAMMTPTLPPFRARAGGWNMSIWIDRARAQAERFWANVSKSDGCWTWTAGKDKDGYGRFSVTAPRGEIPKQRHYRAHRLSWEMANGPIPAGLGLMHSCDNRACVNPAHLTPGTQAENWEDCVSKGRQARGERSGAYTQPHRVPRGARHYAATMTEEQVRTIRALYAEGMRPKVISTRLGLGFNKVWGVTSGRTWKGTG